MLDKLIEILSKEWPVLKSAPFSFLVILASGSILGWVVYGQIHSAIVEGLKQEISVYQAKLSVTSPDEAEKRMNALLLQLDAAKDAIKVITDKKITEAVDPPENMLQFFNPICMSVEDKITKDSMRQILIYNEFINSVRKDVDLRKYCASYKKMQVDINSIQPAAKIE